MRALAIVQEFLTPEVLQVFADAINKGGITPGLNYYRNIDRNWRTTSYLKHRKVPMPALMVSTDGDPILTPRLTEGMEQWVPNVTKYIVRNCGHWSQQECPEEVNQLIIEFINDLKR